MNQQLLAIFARIMMPLHPVPLVITLLFASMDLLPWLSMFRMTSSVKKTKLVVFPLTAPRSLLVTT
jgi:hypothetical protein